MTAAGKDPGARGNLAEVVASEQEKETGLTYPDHMPAGGTGAAIVREERRDD